MSFKNKNKKLQAGIQASSCLLLSFKGKILTYKHLPVNEMSKSTSILNKLKDVLRSVKKKE